MVSKHKYDITMATETDIVAVRNIYDQYSSNAACTVTFEEETPSLGEMIIRWENIRQMNLPFLVCKIDDMVVGYAYATPYRSRAAYRHTIEESVYVDQVHHNKGIGKALLLALISYCKEIDVRCIVAVVGGYNESSLAMHRRVGFKDVGVLHDVGYKNEKWVDTPILEFIIRPDNSR